MGKYTLYTYAVDTGVHWADLAGLSLVLVVKAGLMQDLLTLPAQTAL